ncbi:restriction endonuclease subunit S [Blautia luti]|uniref:restriction endonuclease subunit S n=1 Tax=Blautia luti TaxID=89014 RepID=UPI001D01BCA7|nr:restriction endonuclease subunit S [Blautia luti]MCB5474245.1 restriction endonuclease subunit S [Blautia luti]
MWQYGELPDGWRTEKIGEYASVITDYVANGSFAALAKNVDYKSEPDYAVLIRLTDYNNDFDGNFVYIDKHAYNFLAKSKLYGDEIIISNVGANVGTVFKCPRLDKKMSLAPNAIMLKTKGNDDFYYYWFTSRNGQHSLQSIVTGSAQPKFNKTNFKELLVPVPPLKVQEKIAEYLGKIDQKIEFNKRINKNLYEQMLSIFNNARRTSAWNKHKLGDVLIFFDNLRRPLSSIQREKMAHIYPYYGAASIVDYVEDYLFDGTYILISEDGANVIDSFGRPLTQYTYGKFWVNNHAHIVKGSNGYSEALVYAMLGTLNMQSIVTGAAQPKINQANLRNFEAVLPESEEAQVLSELLNPMLQQMLHHDQENEKLSELRNILLPQLMSGALDVSAIDL